MRRIWRDHSLSIVTAVLGSVFAVVSIFTPEGKWFDYSSGLAIMFLSIGILGWLYSRFREVAKPED